MDIQKISAWRHISHHEEWFATLTLEEKQEELWNFDDQNIKL